VRRCNLRALVDAPGLKLVRARTWARRVRQSGQGWLGSSCLEPSPSLGVRANVPDTARLHERVGAFVPAAFAQAQAHPPLRSARLLLSSRRLTSCNRFGDASIVPITNPGRALRHANHRPHLLPRRSASPRPLAACLAWRRLPARPLHAIRAVRVGHGRACAFAAGRSSLRRRARRPGCRAPHDKFVPRLTRASRGRLDASPLDHAHADRAAG
jgi:hypothetical protein